MLSSRQFTYFVGAILLYGLVYRLLPLVLGPDRVAQFFITEDGYLMLTVARNLALGYGLSVSDATIATNGIQPMATFLYALPYMATGGDKVSSLYAIVAIMTVLSVGAAWAVSRFAGEVLKPFGIATSWGLAAGAIWFVGVPSLFHSMNALETGFYVGMVALTVTAFGQICARGGRYTGRDQVIFGVLCGLTFLVRIDGAFLTIALFATRLIYMPASRQLSIKDAILEAIPPGVITLVFAAPWLLHNQIYFGSIMPISGTAQSMSAQFGQNLSAIPSRLFETMLPMLPIPQSLELTPAVIALCTAVVTPVLLWFLFRVTATKHPMRVAIWAYTLFGCAIVGYYGLSFGARHFLSRYFAPLAPLLITAALWVAMDLSRKKEELLRPLAALALILCVALTVRLALPGVKEQGHFHVVDWVETNVDDETWVAAVQTGTLGYWHDRTINLDGKVNPEALEARRSQGDVLSYITNSKIDVVADWVRVADWVKRGNAEFTAVFEVVERDPASNIGILRRVSE